MSVFRRLRWHRAPEDALTGLLVSAGLVALVTAVIDLLEPHVPLLSLGSLYLFAVLPVAVVWGIAFAAPVAIASMLAFNWFYLPPTHTFTLTDGENWLALAVYSTTAIVVSELAARARRRAVIAEQRSRESALLATVSDSLLRGEDVADELDWISSQVADVLGTSGAWLELGPRSERGSASRAHPLQVDGRYVGTLYTVARRSLDATVEARFLQALASLLAVAADRDELLRDALEAEALRRSDAIKTAVLRAVSHDLRSPLTAISAAVSGLSSPTLELDAADRAELLETIHVESQRLGRLVDDLLDLSRLQAGAARPMPELWSVDELIGLSLDDVRDERVDLDLAGDLPPVLTDAAQIQRVLVNLLENALRHSPAGSPVHLSAKRHDADVVIRVADEGPGIPAGDVHRIFEPFQRGAGAGVHTGSGLGLAIARGFAEVNGARLAAEPSGEGAVFTLALPLAETGVGGHA